MSPLIGIISFINAKLGHIDVLCSVQKSTQYYTAYDFYTKIHINICIYGIWLILTLT